LQVNPGHIFITAITAEESIRGAFKLINDKKPEKIMAGYRVLSLNLYALARYQILPFDDAAYQRFSSIPKDVRRKIGTLDCRIAAIALSRGFKIITRNTQHFQLVPGLTCEDWTMP
jgi:predicted nucleic acid-binding protein